MRRARTFVMVLLGAAAAAAPSQLAAAEISQAPASASDDPSLPGYAWRRLDCVEWTDGCAVCARDGSGVAHCSTPGIACEPQPIRCSPGSVK